ncbi:MAG: transcriptional repressor LexA [Firmicutes bacterium]|jgi:repressor LexA|nr:transcriptional repressor LexA [Bacillota bacterium]
MQELSAKQQQILSYLKSEVQKKGYPPSVREICQAVGLKSTSTVHAHLSRLEKKGYIRRNPTKPRAIEILDQTDKKDVVEVPIVGTITAGTPILAVQNIEDTFPLPVNFLNYDTDVFMLRVKGESMIEAGIFDRDLILVRQQSSADNGDIVVALLEDSATVKTYYKEKDYIRLQPENATMSPIITKDVKVLGKVIGLFRKF